MTTSEPITQEIKKEIISIAQNLIRIKSFSGQEEKIVKFIEKKMMSLGFDEVTIDTMGNVLGRIGSGNKKIMFDSHVDTVGVNDEEKWKEAPFSGKVIDGRLHGRGSVDMKSGAAASIYAAAMAKKRGKITGKTIYVSCTVLEEDCDGENLKLLFNELKIAPNYVVICEPSNNQIVFGHKGKAQITIRTHGVSAHGASPEKGVNAIYEMADVIKRAERTHKNLAPVNGRKGSLIISNISSTSASLNAVPSECAIYLDRRMVPGETENDIQKEMDTLIEGKKASWKIGVLRRKSWTGLDVTYEPLHPAWEIDTHHELSQALIDAYQEIFNRKPITDTFWDFSTNAVTPVRLGIPTIGFGPGDNRMAHMRNENCEVSQIIDACRFYYQTIAKL